MFKVFETVKKLDENTGKMETQFPLLADYFDDDPDCNDGSFCDPTMVDIRRDYLLQLTPDQIYKVTPVGDVWYDDHLPCINATIEFIDGNVLNISACWLIPERVGMFIYSDSKQARIDLVDYLKGTANDA